MKYIDCPLCGDDVAIERWRLGKHYCLDCGEKIAQQERKGWCVAPMAKSNYFYVSDPTMLKQLNPKRIAT